MATAAFVSLILTSPAFSVGTTEQPHIRIAVAADGGVAVDGKPSTLKQLDSSLAKLKTLHGVIWYTRDVGNGELSPTQLVVFQHLVQTRLPIRLYTDRTFKTVAP